LLQNNKILFFIPNFDFIVFYLNTLWILVYRLKKQYKLIVCVNFNYAKSKLRYLGQFNKFILKSFSIHWFRVAFRGKGFRLRKFKTKSKVTLNFGHSHWAKLALDQDLYFFKKIKRQNYLCFAKSYLFYKTIKNDIKFFKKLNSYTKRGLRLKKQFIKKRFGKISQVVSSLH
jgi:hypothetical protein